VDVAGAVPDGIADHFVDELDDALLARRFQEIEHLPGALQVFPALGIGDLALKLLPLLLAHLAPCRTAGIEHVIRGHAVRRFGCLGYRHTLSLSS